MYWCFSWGGACADPSTLLVDVQVFFESLHFFFVQGSQGLIRGRLPFLQWDMVVLSVVGRRCHRLFFGEYFEEFVIFHWNWIFAVPGGFLDFVD